MARDFSGSSQYLRRDAEIVQWNTPHSYLPHTLVGWFRSDSATARQVLVSVGHNTNGYSSIQIRGDVSGDPIEAGRASSTGAYNSAQSTSGYSTGTWHHAAAVFAADNDRTIYLDGGSSANSTSTTGTIPPANEHILIGARIFNSDAGLYLDGRAAEVAVYNVTLTAEEINALAKGVSPLRIRPQNIIFYVPIYGVGSPEPSVVGDHPFTLNGTPTQADHAPVQQLIVPRLWVPSTAAAADDRTLTAESGSFTLTGQAATLDIRTFPQEGGHTTTGQDGALNTTLTAGTGAFTLTGQDVGLLKSESITAETGSFTVSGQDSDLVINLVAGEQAHTTTGQDGVLNTSLTAGTGSFVLTGQDVTLEISGQQTLNAEAGSFILTGQDASLQIHLTAAKDDHVVTGEDGVLDTTILAGTGSFVLTGQDIDLVVPQSQTLTAETGEFFVTGQEVILIATSDFEDTGAGAGRYQRADEEYWEDREKHLEYLRKAHERIEKAEKTLVVPKQAKDAKIDISVTIEGIERDLSALRTDRARIVDLIETVDILARRLEDDVIIVLLLADI